MEELDEERGYPRVFGMHSKRMQTKRILIEQYKEKKVEQLYKVSHPCLNDHQFKKEELEPVGELSEVCSQMVFRSHFGSRAISVQLNIVAVSDHVFHRFPFDLLNQVSATQLSLFCISSVFMVDDRAFDDAMRTSLPASPMPLSSNVVSPNGSLPDLEGTGIHPTTMDEKNQRNVHTKREVATARAEYIQIRKLRPDAFPDSGLV